MLVLAALIDSITSPAAIAPLTLDQFLLTVSDSFA